MRVVVPFAVATPKTRLSETLTKSERREFARAMLSDILEAIAETGQTPEVLATEPIDLTHPVIVDDDPLTPAVNHVLERTDEPVAILMADLALATPRSLNRFFNTRGGVVLAPGRGGGTNGIIARHGDFRVDYHGTSFFDHLANARAVGATVSIVDSFRLAIDIDEQSDLVELLIHGDGAAREWLVQSGFELDETDGRVSVSRT